MLLIPFALLAALVSSDTEGVASWPQFRGPGGLAVAAETPLPADFGAQKHVLWKASVPAGHSSPCVHAGRIFLTGFEEGQNVVFAIDRSNGERLWEQRFEGEPHPDYMHVHAVPALPTVCTDGERVIAYLENYGVVALDLAGKKLWERRLELPGYNFGVGTSPILAGGNVIVMRDGTPEAAVLALDAATGEEAWSINRLGCGESHGSPFLWRNAEREELVLSGTLRVSGYDPASGELLWNLGGTTVFPCTTPTADADSLYFAAWSTPNADGRSLLDAGFGRSLELAEEEYADTSILFARLDTDGDGKIVPEELPECRGKDAFGFLDQDADGSWSAEELAFAGKPIGAPGENKIVAVPAGAAGELEPDDLRWSYKRGIPYVASPLLYRGRIWMFKSGGLVTVLDADTGEPLVSRERLEDRSEYYASPVGAGGVVLVGTAAGTLYVLDASLPEGKLEVLNTVVFDEELFATPAVVEGKVYVRTTTTLWAFGEER